MICKVISKQRKKKIVFLFTIFRALTNQGVLSLQNIQRLYYSLYICLLPSMKNRRSHGLHYKQWQLLKSLLCSTLILLICSCSKQLDIQTFFMDSMLSSIRTSQYIQRCKKTTFLHKQGLNQNNVTRKKCVNYDKSDFE